MANKLINRTKNAGVVSEDFGGARSCSSSPVITSLVRKRDMKKEFGHYCRICGCRKPNEAFSGHGHHSHVCKACSKTPKSELKPIEQKDEIFNFLKQSHISQKNVSRLEQLLSSEDEEVLVLAGIVLEVAKVTPYKKRRLKVLARERRDLLEQLDETGLILAHHW
jgi:hypothetical protein